MPWERWRCKLGARWWNGARSLLLRGRQGSRAGTVENRSREGLMRWLRAGVVVLSVTTTTGCPSEFGKEGRVAKAVHADSQDQLSITRCSDVERKRVCGPGKENSDECRRCGGP